MRSRRALLLALLPWMVVSILFVLVHQAQPGTPLFRRTLPREPFDPQRCNWYCHNHGCRHRPLLPSWLTGDRGLFGKAIGGLHRTGAQLHIGYGGANLLLFCIAWPALTYGLYLTFLWQRRRLGER